MLAKCLMFAFQGSSSRPAVNTESSGEFSVDFALVDVSNAESPAGECSMGPGPSQSRPVAGRLAKRLRRKQDREGLLRIHGAPPPDLSKEDYMPVVIESCLLDYLHSVCFLYALSSICTPDTVN